MQLEVVTDSKLAVTSVLQQKVKAGASESAATPTSRSARLLASSEGITIDGINGINGAINGH